MTEIDVTNADKTTYAMRTWIRAHTPVIESVRRFLLDEKLGGDAWKIMRREFDAIYDFEATAYCTLESCRQDLDDAQREKNVIAGALRCAIDLRKDAEKERDAALRELLGLCTKVSEWLGEPVLTPEQIGLALDKLQDDARKSNVLRSP